MTNESVSSLRNLSRSTSLINVELIFHGLVRDILELFVLVILIRAWDFAISVRNLTYVVIASMSCVVITKAFLVVLEILVDLTIVPLRIFIRVRGVKHFLFIFLI